MLCLYIGQMVGEERGCSLKKDHQIKTKLKSYFNSKVEVNQDRFLLILGRFHFFWCRNPVCLR